MSLREFLINGLEDDPVASFSPLCFGVFSLSVPLSIFAIIIFMSSQVYSPFFQTIPLWANIIICIILIEIPFLIIISTDEKESYESWFYFVGVNKFLAFGLALNVLWILKPFVKVLDLLFKNISQVLIVIGSIVGCIVLIIIFVWINILIAKGIMRLKYGKKKNGIKK